MHIHKDASKTNIFVNVYDCDNDVCDPCVHLCVCACLCSNIFIDNVGFVDIKLGNLY